MEKNWLDREVSLYASHYDNIGRPVKMREILFSNWDEDFEIIQNIRNLNKSDTDYHLKKRDFKNKLHCYTPSALFKTKAKGKVSEIVRTGVLQLDFDYEDIKGYDIEELKSSVFKLPFIGFCGLSCSGDGFYALAIIKEPNLLCEYAQHCFEIFKSYNLKPDTSKGRKPENLRYISIDINKLVRENPNPLFIKNLSQKSIKTNYHFKPKIKFKNDSIFLEKLLNEIKNVKKGNRWATIQRVSYTLGGYRNSGYLEYIRELIISNKEFIGEEAKYLKCANDCFIAGSASPFEQ